jgi:hypothetical protein
MGGQENGIFPEKYCAMAEHKGTEISFVTFEFPFVLRFICQLTKSHD